METVVDSTVFLFPTLENLKLVTGQRLLDWSKHNPALVGEITESIADGAAHEEDHVVLSRAFTVTHHPQLRPEGVDCRHSHGRRARQCAFEVPFITAEAPLIIAASESRGLPNSAGGRQQRGTRGADIPPVRCLLSRTHETGSKSSWLSGWFSLLLWPFACVGRSCVGWSAVLVLGAVVVSSCRVWSSGPVSGLVPRICFFLCF